jgi:mannose-6-phosphate isomerase-like protein (cupin superfamily)
MMKSLLVGLTLGLIACVSAVCAADGTGAKHWTSDDSASLMKSGVRDKLVNEKSHYAFFVHKEGGQPAQPAEMHESVAEFWIVMDGQASVQAGGKLGTTKTKGPGEFASDTLDGATTYDLKKGDVLYIPIGVPHRVLVGPGQKLDFLMIKVDEAARGAPR